MKFTVTYGSQRVLERLSCKTGAAHLDDVPRSQPLLEPSFSQVVLEANVFGWDHCCGVREMI